MFRKLLIIALLCSSIHGFAQQNTKISGKGTPTVAPTPIDYTQPGAPMPPLILISLDSIQDKETSRWHKMWHKRHDNDPGPTSIITTDDINEVKANILVMIFNPTCSHCANACDMLERNMDLFKKSKLVMVCNPALRANLPDFTKQHAIKSYPNIIIGVDSAGFMGKAFLYRLLPQINIYDKNRKLIKIYSGDISIDSLKEYIQ